MMGVREHCVHCYIGSILARDGFLPEESAPQESIYKDGPYNHWRTRHGHFVGHLWCHGIPKSWWHSVALEEVNERSLAMTKHVMWVDEQWFGVLRKAPVSQLPKRLECSRQMCHLPTFKEKRCEFHYNELLEKRARRR